MNDMTKENVLTLAEQFDKRVAEPQRDEVDCYSYKLLFSVERIDVVERAASDHGIQLTDDDVDEILDAIDDSWIDEAIDLALAIWIDNRPAENAAE